MNDAHDMAEMVQWHCLSWVSIPPCAGTLRWCTKPPSPWALAWFSLMSTWRSSLLLRLGRVDGDHWLKWARQPETHDVQCELRTTYAISLSSLASTALYPVWKHSSFVSVRSILNKKLYKVNCLEPFIHLSADPSLLTVRLKDEAEIKAKNSVFP